MNDEEKAKYALEELNRLLRYIDNFYWVLSSFWMAGTGFAISKALEWDGCNSHIIGLSLIVILAWILYMFFTKYVKNISLYYLQKVDEYEKYLRIDILPKNPIKGTRFNHIMYIIAILSIFVMCVFLIEYYIN